MSACNERPPASHPFSALLVACHMTAGHEGPHTWEAEPSPARRGVDLLLSVMRNREIESIDSQPARPILVYDVSEDGARAAIPTHRYDTPPGPWVLVTFVGGDEYAIWKHSGDVYRVDPASGAVDEDPILTLEHAAQ